MANKKPTFKNLKALCDDKAHERQSCKKGYRALLQSESVSDLMRTWREHLYDIVGDRYSDIVVSDFARYYEAMREEVNAAGFYFNEAPQITRRSDIVLVGDMEEELSVRGYGTIYVLGAATVHAYGNTTIYSKRQAEAKVVLHDYAHGDVTMGTAVCYNRSDIVSSVETECHDAASVVITGTGVLNDYGHRAIRAYGNSLVRTALTRNITLTDNATIEQ